MTADWDDLRTAGGNTGSATRMLLQNTVTAQSCDDCVKACKGASVSCSMASATGAKPVYKCDCSANGSGGTSASKSVSTSGPGTGGEVSKSVSVGNSAGSARMQGWLTGSFGAVLSLLVCSAMLLLAA